jgi:hypothetical protein
VGLVALHLLWEEMPEVLEPMELVTKARSHKEGCCVYICKVDDNGKICDRRITDFDNIPDGFVSVDKTVFYNSGNWQFVEGEFVKIIPESAELPTMGARLAAAEAAILALMGV